MVFGLKKLAKQLIVSAPILNRVYFRRRIYPRTMDEKQLRGRIQYVGHILDLRLSQGVTVPVGIMREFEFILRELRDRKISVDEPLAWAIDLYVAAKHGLALQEAKPATATDTGDTGRPGIDGFIELIKTRRSVRKWTTEPVDMDDIEEVIEIAKWAPSSCNRQLWQTLLITDDSDKEFLSRYFGNTFWLRAPMLAVVLVDTGLYGASTKHFAYLDGAAFIQTMLLALHAKGYGACWVSFAGWTSSDMLFIDREKYDAFYKYFGLPEQKVPVSMIALGWPAGQPKAPARQDVSKIIIRDFLGTR